MDILELVNREFGSPIAESDRIDHLGADSLDMLGLVHEIEMVFKVDMTPADLRQMVTVGDICRYVREANAHI